MSKGSKHSEYYAVLRGFYIAAPTIFSSWGDAHPVVTGFSGQDFCGFETLAEAEDHMDIKGVKNYNYNIKYGAGKTSPVKGQPAYYAVANGREPDIQEYYHGRGGAEPKVVSFSGACHKRFRTRAQAEAFISDWIEMFACVAKANIRRGLLGGHRPAHMQEWSLQFEWKKDADEVEDELVEGMGEIKLRSAK